MLKYKYISKRIDNYIINECNIDGKIKHVAKSGKQLKRNQNSILQDT